MLAISVKCDRIRAETVGSFFDKCCWGKNRSSYWSIIGGFKVKVSDAITKHNSARGANTMEFPIGKFAGGANTMVKTIDSRWRRKP